jgi:hypothetical protein
MTARPTTMWLKLKRRMACDGNPLRRRSDVIAAWLTPVAVLIFVALIPVAATVTSSLARAENAAVARAMPAWHVVDGRLLRSAPGPEQTNHGGNLWNEVVPAQWTFRGHQHSGAVPVLSGSRAGDRQKVYLNDAGQVQTPPLDPSQLADRTDTITFIALGVLAMVLLTLKAIARRILDGRRLAAWESDWLAVGPRWSHQG